MEERSFYCVGSFINKLYLIGGWIKSCGKSLRSCYTFDINSSTLNKIADLNVARELAACTVFEGKIVVTGGFNYYDRDLKSVEAYDYYENKWSYLSDMIEGRFDHAAVSMSNKLFVIGGRYTTSCEIFDSYSRQFTEIESDLTVPNMKSKYSMAACIGDYILVFHSYSSYDETTTYLYDVCENKWSNIKCDFTKNLFDLSIFKYYI